MKPFLLRPLMLQAMFSVVALMLISTAFAGKCCQNTSGCSGCFQISSSPARYVQLGDNTVKKCQTNSLPTSCDEETVVCYEGEDVPLYETGCSNQVGTTSLTRRTPQCGGMDDWCGGE